MNILDLLIFSIYLSGVALCFLGIPEIGIPLTILSVVGVMFLEDQ